MTVDGKVVASIGKGLVVLVGLTEGDGEGALDHMVKKLLNLRLFDDAEGKAWAASVQAISGDVLLVSQFTLYGTTKGNKPDFHLAMSTDPASVLYARFVSKVQAAYKGGRVCSGVFGANMAVALVNDGPVTLSIDTDGHDFSKEDAKFAKAQARFGGKQNGAAASAATAKPMQNGEAACSSPAAPAEAASSSPAPADSPSTSPVSASSSSSAAPSEAASSVPASSPSASPSPSPSSSSSGAVDPAAFVASAPATLLVPSASPLYSGSSFASLVGNTPLILLRGLSTQTGCRIYGKAEYANPGGSIKDRAACAILQAAEASGALVHGKPGWIVEGTAGNTGIGLTLAGAARGYRTLVVLASNNSQEKKDALRSLGATLLEVPMVPFSNNNNYVHVAARVFEAMKASFAKSDPECRVILADQWSNPANRAAHEGGTGPEIWKQTGGKIDAFCCGVGTGGTLSGTSLFLRSAAAAAGSTFQSVLVDPEGSALKDYFESGVLRSSGSSVSEGIGQGRLCDNLVRDGFKPDSCVRITDAEALPLAWALLREEGISVGSSSAINVAGALAVARKLGPGHTIVTVLCDSGTRYTSKMSNPAFLLSKQLPVPTWLDERDQSTKAEHDATQSWLQDALAEGDRQQAEKEKQQQQQSH